MKKNSMDKFVSAYVWLFGVAKKTAKEIYRNADDNYISTVISAYEKQAIIAFYED